MAEPPKDKTFVGLAISFFAARFYGSTRIYAVSKRNQMEEVL